jgi:phosphatidylglycerophosphate synthase
VARTRSGSPRRSWVPFAITGLRLASAPFLLCALMSGMEEVAIGLFVFACATDLLDGHVARKLDESTARGAYFDAAADFVFAFMAFLAFAMQGVYPFWTLGLFSAMFLQFVLTSGFARPVYDPVGKYYGAFLFLAIGVTLGLPDSGVYCTVLVSIVGLTVVSVACRSVTMLVRGCCTTDMRDGPEA